MSSARQKRTSSFIDTHSQEAFLAHYNAMLQRWPAHEKVQVTGRYGRTTVLTTGTPGAPDLVLLHGRNTPSPSWTPLITELAAHYRVHAIDSIGEPGLSSNDGERLSSRADYITWLTETLDGLALPAPHLCGYSFGGWLAARFAVEHPQRVATLTLLDPAQVFAPFSARWLLACIRPFFSPTEPTIRGLFEWAGRGLTGHEELVELATLGMLSFRIRAPEATRVSRSGLRGLRVPTQQLIGEHTVVHNPQRALRTAARLNPAVTSHLVRGSSHFLPYDQPGQVLTALHEIVDAPTGDAMMP